MSASTGGAAEGAAEGPAPRGRRRVVPRRFYARDSLEVAPELLNKLLVRHGRAGRIVEVEAYRGSEDPASHAFRGPTRRNATMFGPPGRLYVYFTYGMHWCANAVCGADGVAQAVLLRALAPVSGHEEMRLARARRAGTPPPDLHLASGPARLCQALGIDGADDGADLVRGDRGLRILDDGTPPPARPGVSGRVGVTNAAHLPWRFWVPGDRNVSRRDGVALPGASRPARRRPSPRRGPGGAR